METLLFPCITNHVLIENVEYVLGRIRLLFNISYTCAISDILVQRIILAMQYDIFISLGLKVISHKKNCYYVIIYYPYEEDPWLIIGVHSPRSSAFSPNFLLLIFIPKNNTLIFSFDEDNSE